MIVVLNYYLHTCFNCNKMTIALVLFSKQTRKHNLLYAVWFDSSESFINVLAN